MLVLNGTTGITSPAIDLTTPLAVADGGTGVGGIPCFSAYLSAAQTGITSSTWTKVLCNTEEFDLTAAYDNVTNYRFTPLVAGYYQVCGSVGVSSASGMTRVAAAIYVTGVLTVKGSDNAPYTSTAGNASVSGIVYCNGSTNYIELWGIVIGTTNSFQNTLTGCHFSACLVRSA